MQGHVVMGTEARSVHQQVIEKTKGLLFRTQVHASHIEKRLSTQANTGYQESSFAVSSFIS